jgi:hypothetical protein
MGLVRPSPWGRLLALYEKNWCVGRGINADMVREAGGLVSLRSL